MKSNTLLGEEPNVEHHGNPGEDENSEHYWFARHDQSIIFLIIVLGIIGIYEAFQLPVAVFPTTNFPLIKMILLSQVINGALRIGCGGENRAPVVLQDFEP